MPTETPKGYPPLVLFDSLQVGDVFAFTAFGYTMRHHFVKRDAEHCERVGGGREIAFREALTPYVFPVRGEGE